MLTRLLKERVLFLLLAGVLVVLWGCKREEVAKPAPAAAPAETEAVDEAEEYVEGEEYEEGEEYDEEGEYDEDEEGVEEEEEDDSDEMDAAEDQMEMLKAKLAKADLLDGKEDMIVTRCATCALSMDGKPEHSTEVMGYTMYFCSDQCLKSFEADTTKALTELVVPEE